MAKVRGARRAVSSAMLAGVLVGGGAILLSQEINERTAGDDFCVTCHTMQVVADEPRYVHSAHRANAEGVRATCGDCHIPASNYFIESYTHLYMSVKDTYVELTRDFSDPDRWAAHRVELARRVRREMRENDSATCRSCHDPAAIAPASEAGRNAHAQVPEGNSTCIDCHLNMVHAPPRPGG